MTTKEQILKQTDSIAKQIGYLKEHIESGLTKEGIMQELDNLLNELHEIHDIYYREDVLKEKERIERITNPVFYL